MLRIVRVISSKISMLPKTWGKKQWKKQILINHPWKFWILDGRNVWHACLTCHLQAQGSSHDHGTVPVILNFASVGMESGENCSRDCTQKTSGGKDLPQLDKPFVGAQARAIIGPQRLRIVANAWA